MNAKEKITQQLLHLIIHINQPDRGTNEQELAAASLLLTTIELQEAQKMLSRNEAKKLERMERFKSHLSNNPKQYVVIVGDSRLKKSQIIGVTKSFGLDESRLRLHLDYQKLRDNFPFEECQNQKCIGVIIGPTPHNVAGKNGHESPYDGLNTILGVPVILCEGMKLSKESLRTALEDLAKKTTTSSTPVSRRVHIEWPKSMQV